MAFEAKACCVPFCYPNCNSKDHHPLVRILCEFPCNISSPCQNQQRCLEDAITDAQADGWGISSDVPESAPNCPKLPLMYWAALLGKGRAIDCLVEEGFSSKSSNSSGTALSLAMKYMIMTYAKCNEISQAVGSFQHVADILYKSDGGVEDADGRIALNLACEQYVTSLVQPGVDSTSFRKGVLSTLLSLSNGPNTAGGSSHINHADVDGNTPLHILASRDECSEFVEILLSKGADPTLQNKSGKTPCEVAQGCGQHLVARCLFRANTKPASNPLAKVATSDFPTSGNSLPVAVPLNGVSSDVSQQVREHVKNHVNNRHAQQALTTHPIESVRVARLPPPQLASHIKELHDVCSVDFALLNQQSIPANPGARHPRLLQNGVSSSVTSHSPYAHVVNGDAGNEADMGNHYLVASPAYHRRDFHSPPMLHSTAVCNGRSVGTSQNFVAHRSHFASMSNHAYSGDLSADSSSEEEEPMMEEGLLMGEEDEFVGAMGELKTLVGRDVLASIVAPESKRRFADYSAARSQHRQAKDAFKQLKRRGDNIRRDCRILVSEIDDIKEQLMLVRDELSQRTQRCELLEHERIAIDSQYKLSQLQLLSSNRALEAVPLAYQMNIEFDEEASLPLESPSQGTTSSGHVDATTPSFDTASVSSTPVDNFGLCM